MTRILAAILLTLTLAGCADESFEIVAGAADEGDEAYGVGHLTRHVPVRVDEVVRTDLYVPTSGEWPASGPFRVAVLAQGGNVAAERYAWIGEFLARRGVISIVPHFQGRLAFFSQGDVADVLETVRAEADDPGDLLHGRIARGRAVSIGHSLGGVVVSGAWLSQPSRFEHTVILASFPAAFEDYERDGPDGDRIVSIVGGEDPRVSVEQAREPLEKIDARSTVVLVEGVTHFQFANGLEEGEDRDDGTPGVDLDEAHRRIGFVLQTLFDEPARLDDPDTWPEGVVAP